jgi:hypothetical protein
MGAAMVIAPHFTVKLQHVLSTFLFLGKPAFFAANETVNVLLCALGAVAVGFVVPLARAIKNRDQEFAKSLAWFHVATAILTLIGCRAGTPGFKFLLPFVAHDILSAAAIFASVPDSSPLWQSVFSKLKLA